MKIKKDKLIHDTHTQRDSHFNAPSYILCFTSLIKRLTPISYATPLVKSNLNM